MFRRGVFAITSYRISILSNSEVVHCRRWARALRKQGHEVVVLTPYDRNIEGVPTIFAPLYPSVGEGVLRYSEALRNIIHYRRRIDQVNPDIVHVLGLFTFMAPDLMFAVLGWDNTVVTTWGTDIVPPPHETEGFKQNIMKRFLLGRGEQLTGTSEYLSGEMKKYLPDEEEVHVVPYGVDLGHFSPENESKDDPEKLENSNSGRDLSATNILFPKGLERKYGPDVLLRAFSRVSQRRTELKLRMLGRGAMEKRLKQFVEKRNLDDRVEFSGKIPHRDMPEEFEEADIAVMPSRVESFGVAALEALAMEVPVIATDVGGFPEVVLDGETGILVAPEDERELARALRNLAADPDRRRKLGKKGRTFVENHYSWKDCVTRMEQVYKLMMETGR